MQDSIKSPTDNASRPIRTRGLAFFSVIALVLVILGSALLLHGHSQQTGAQSSQSPLATVQRITCQGSALGCNAPSGIIGTSAPSTDQGITMQVTYAHLDALATTIFVTITSDTRTLGVALVLDGTMTDATGQVIAPLMGGDSGRMLNPHKDLAFYYLLPLSDTQLRQTQHFTFTAHQLMTIEGKPVPTNNVKIIGSWRSTFTVNPTLGTEYHIQTAPVTVQGVSFHVNSLEVAPAIAQNGDIPAVGGVRIMLTATHVPADTLMESFAPWFPTTGPRFTSCPSSGCPPYPGPTSAVLTLPGFVPGQAPNGISFLLPSTIQSTPETVGPTQTVQIELLYPGGGTLSGANGLLTITNFHLFTSLTPTPADLKQTPAWQLPIPLHT